MDSFLFGFCYEIKIKHLPTNRGIFSSKIFDWVYDLIAPVVNLLFSKIIIYRVFQKIIEISGIVLVGYLYNWNIIPICGLLISHYFMTYDLGYYLLLNQWNLLENSHSHLTKWYTIGKLIFFTDTEAFDIKIFIIAGLIGFIILVITGLKLFQ